MVVWNSWIKDEVEQVFKTKAVKPPVIRGDEDHYYINFYDNSRKSIVTGPFFKKGMEETIVDICKTGSVLNKYESIRDALDAIEKTFHL